MYIPKKYGQSKIENCPFCGKAAVTRGKQGFPVCAAHKTDELSNNIKCACGEYLELRTGKWGAYFNCLNCGNVTWKKAIEANPNMGQQQGEDVSQSQGKQVKAPSTYKVQSPSAHNTSQALRPAAKEDKKKEMLITSDELDFYCQ